MKTHLQTDVWIRRFVITLATFVCMSLVVAIIRAVVGQHTPEIIIVLSLVAIVGLSRQLISPLNRRLL